MPLRNVDSARSAGLQRKAAQHGDQQHLQDLAPGEGIEESWSGMMFSRKSTTPCFSACVA